MYQREMYKSTEMIEYKIATNMGERVKIPLLPYRVGKRSRTMVTTI